MLDIKWIRENPTKLDKNLQKRGAVACASVLISLDETLREKMTELQTAQSQRNNASKQIGQLKAQGEDASSLMAEVSALGPKLKALEADVKTLEEDLQSRLLGLPNLLNDDVPEGADETENVEVKRWGQPKAIANPKAHYDLGEALQQMDFSLGAKLAGSRFVFLQGQIARLERALTNFFLDTHITKHGYTEASTPFMVNETALIGTGQLPKFGEDLFQVQDGYYLIPTSEVPLTNVVQDEITATQSLPIKLTAATPCFRREAGAAGRDTRGMIRLHQFIKVEMVQIVKAEQGEEAFKEMVGQAESLLQALELPYRVVQLCAGDMGASARKTHDLEVWLPSQDTYREISSVSYCGDFQARRMKARHRAEGEKQTAFVHTLNGSGLAVGRTLVALLENHQEEDGAIHIPEVLRSYMGGESKITLPKLQTVKKAV